MLNEGTAKVRLGSYLVQKAKNKVLLGFSSTECAKIKDGGVLIFLKC